jgi:hypothetical protein
MFGVPIIESIVALKIAAVEILISKRGNILS